MFIFETTTHKNKFLLLQILKLTLVNKQLIASYQHEAFSL